MAEQTITLIGNNVEVSDGYHTFSELYTHRILLFLALMKSHPHGSWKSKKHDDGTLYEGYFVAGMELPTGMITYHIPLEQFWDHLPEIQELEFAPKWDGHTSEDVILRLSKWLGI
jgi:hypothetical protein